MVNDAVDLHEDFVEVPAPLGQGGHPVDPSSQYLGRGHGTKPVPPQSHALMADLDALLRQVLDVAQRELVADLGHYGHADDLGTGLEEATAEYLVISAG
jgi:hypothetical protein